MKLLLATLITCLLLAACGSSNDNSSQLPTNPDQQPLSVASEKATTTTAPPTTTTRSPEPDCGEEKRSRYTYRTNSWSCVWKSCEVHQKRDANGKCRELSLSEKRDKKCSKSPRLGWPGENNRDGKCLVLVCETSKGTTPSSYFKSAYSCGGEWYDDGTSPWHQSHPKVRPYTKELGWQAVAIVKTDLGKLGFRNCVDTYHHKVNIITEYDGVAFWCD